MAGVVHQWPQGSTPTNTIPYRASMVNSFRISAVMDRLDMHVRATPRSDPDDFSNLCLSLARGIDYAVANSEIPLRASDLPLLVKQVYQRKCEFSLQPVIMMLMISMKSACKSGWFLAKDADELLKLTNEIGSIFWSEENIHTEPSNVIPIISKIMASFYPRMEMGHIFVSLEIKPGFGTYVTDFDIPKRAMNPKDKIHLFVAQIDNTETSSCIISPPLVSFLLNGKGVEKRTNITMDNGPQLPANVTSMLKYGTNLLQAIGEFNGTYIITIVFMSMTSSSEAPVLQDYVRPLLTAQNSDSEIIEGSSRISLNCPISLKRIKTPVKGHLCKHHQCFDYDFFIEINLRRPSWRCPQCDQSVSYTDIRIDQFMVEVLQEVGESVVDVLISADGSWKPVTEGSECTESLGRQQDWSKHSGSSKSAGVVVDLTTYVMDDADPMDTWEMEDRKPPLDTLQGLSSATNMARPLEVNNNAFQVVPVAAHQMEDGIWSGIFSTCSSSFGMASGNSDPPHAHFMMSSVPTTISPSPGQVMESSSQLLTSQTGNSIVQSDGERSSIMRNITRVPVAVQALPAQAAPNLLQQPRTSFNSLMPNVAPPVTSQTPFSSRSYPAQTVPNSHQWSSTSLNSLIPNVTPPVASIQALPAQTIPNSHQLSSTNLNSFMPTPVASQTPLADGFNKGASNLDRQQQFVWSPVNPVSTCDMASSSVLHHLVPQRYFSTTQPPSMVGPSSTQFLHNRQAPDLRVRQSSSPPQIMVGPSTNFPHHQQAPHLRVPQSTPPPASMVGPSSTHLPVTHIQQGVQCSGSQVVNIHSQLTVTSAQRSSTLARVPPVTPVQLQRARIGSSFPTGPGGNIRTSSGEQHRGNMGGMVQAVSRTEDLVGSDVTEQNWRPQGRMRGSLSGRALSGALSQFIIQPTQSAPQFVRPPHDLTLQPSGHLQFQTLLHSMNAERQQGVPTMTGDTIARPRSGSSGITHS